MTVNTLLRELVVRSVINAVLQGHLAPISSVDDVDAVMSRLLEDAKIASATHNILGYRVYDESSKKIVQVG